MTTGSMRPTIEPGDFLLIETAPGLVFEAGDLALLPAFAKPGLDVVHRVVGTVRKDGERCLVTKGDACLRLDPLTPESAASGRVVFLGRRDQAWIRLDAPSARRRGRLAAAAFAWVAAAADSRGMEILESAARAAFAPVWAEAAIERLIGGTLRRGWSRARGARKMLLRLALAGKRRRENPDLVLESVNRALGLLARRSLESARVLAAPKF